MAASRPTAAGSVDKAVRQSSGVAFAQFGCLAREKQHALAQFSGADRLWMGLPIDDNDVGSPGARQFENGVAARHS